MTPGSRRQLSQGNPQPARARRGSSREWLEGEEFIREHSALLVAYRRRDWVTALNLLDDSRLASVFHLTPVYDIYRRRIAHFQTDAPPEDWDGVYAAEEK
jgi:hypothetical protein